MSWPLIGRCMYDVTECCRAAEYARLTAPRIRCLLDQLQFASGVREGRCGAAESEWWCEEAERIFDEVFGLAEYLLIVCIFYFR